MTNKKNIALALMCLAFASHASPTPTNQEACRILSEVIKDLAGITPSQLVVRNEEDLHGDEPDLDKVFCFDTQAPPQTRVPVGMFGDGFCTSHQVFQAPKDAEMLARDAEGVARAAEERCQSMNTPYNQFGVQRARQAADEAHAEFMRVRAMVEGLEASGLEQKCVPGFKVSSECGHQKLIPFHLSQEIHLSSCRLRTVVASSQLCQLARMFEDAPQPAEAVEWSQANPWVISTNSLINAQALLQNLATLSPADPVDRDGHQKIFCLASMVLTLRSKLTELAGPPRIASTLSSLIGPSEPVAARPGTPDPGQRVVVHQELLLRSPDPRTPAARRYRTRQGSSPQGSASSSRGRLAERGGVRRSLSAALMSCDRSSSPEGFPLPPEPFYADSDASQGPGRPFDSSRAKRLKKVVGTRDANGNPIGVLTETKGGSAVLTMFQMRGGRVVTNDDGNPVPRIDPSAPVAPQRVESDSDDYGSVLDTSDEGGALDTDAEDDSDEESTPGQPEGRTAPARRPSAIPIDLQASVDGSLARD